MQMTRRTAARLVVLALAALPLTGCSYNTFVSQEEAIKAQWAQVQNQLQRRNDLIPESRRDGQGLRRARRGRLQGDRRRAIAAARGASRRRKRFRPRTSRRRALGRLLAIVENYPQLQGQRAVQPADGRARPAPRTASRSSACATTSGFRSTTPPPAVPGERDGEDVRLQGISVLRGAAGSQAGAEGGFQPALVGPAKAGPHRSTTINAEHAEIASHCGRGVRLLGGPSCYGTPRFLRSSLSRHEAERRLCVGAHGGLGECQRKILPRRPEPGQIREVRAVGRFRLSRGIRRNRPIPVGHIEDRAERRSDTRVRRSA